MRHIETAGLTILAVVGLAAAAVVVTGGGFWLGVLLTTIF